MSVFGGDSWAREAQYRKRRVEDVVVERLDASSYKKLCSGKYACLVCPHNPVLDTPLMLSMHIKGSRHCAAESRLKEKQLAIQDEISKRIGLSEGSAGATESITPTQVNRHCRLIKKPLTEQTRRAATEILSNKTTQQSEAVGNNLVKSNKGQSMDGPFHYNNNSSSPAIEVGSNLVAQQQSDLWERRERELKFTAAGWKRDGHGKWFRDENVEFDSDEEDPNVSLVL